MKIRWILRVFGAIMLSITVWMVLTGAFIMIEDKYIFSEKHTWILIIYVFLPILAAVATPVLIIRKRFKKKSHKKVNKNSVANSEEPIPSTYDNLKSYDNIRLTEQVNTKQDNPIVCFAYGHIVRMYPEPSTNYYDNLDLIFKASHIECDMVSFDLNNKNSIKMIPIPDYRIHAENRIDQQIGSFGSIEHLLKRKSDQYYNEGKYDLSLACAKKSAELMQYSDVDWSKSDYQLIIWRLEELGEKNKARHLSEWVDKHILTAEQEIPLILSGELDKELSNVQKEIIMVKNVTLDAMRKFPSLPYNFNCPIQQDIKEGTHPTANMDLDKENQRIALESLEYLNSIIEKSRNRIKPIPKKVRIPIKDIIFKPVNTGYGYSHLVCTPYTPTGKLAKHPIYLFFTTDLDKSRDETHGTVHYGKNGLISKAEVYIWKNKTGFAFSFRTVEGSLILQAAKSSMQSSDGSFVTVYKYGI